MMETEVVICTRAVREPLFENTPEMGQHVGDLINICDAQSGCKTRHTTDTLHLSQAHIAVLSEPVDVLAEDVMLQTLDAYQSGSLSWNPRNLRERLTRGPRTKLSDSKNEFLMMVSSHIAR